MPRHDRTREAVFARPTRANIAWKEIEAMCAALGATIEEGEGSRVRVVLHAIPATFHRPHPGKEATRPMVRAVRDFLIMAGEAPPPREAESVTYKGYSAEAIEIDEDSGTIFGRVALRRGVATFEGSTVAEAARAFRDSVDDYLAMCAEHKIEPEPARPTPQEAISTAS